MSKTYLLKLSAKGARIGGDITREEFDKGRSLEQLQKAVGGYIERAFVRFPAKYANIDCFVDEEGLLKDLPIVNKVVSELCRDTTGENVVGDAVFALHDEEGETYGLTEELCDELTAFLKVFGATEGKEVQA